jgi:hypothetical protein
MSQSQHEKPSGLATTLYVQNTSNWIHEFLMRFNVKNCTRSNQNNIHLFETGEAGLGLTVKVTLSLFTA